jgi:glutamine synthetase
MLESLNVLTKAEIESRYNVRLERYNKVRTIELVTMLDLINTHVLPAALTEQNGLSHTIRETKAAGGKTKILEDRFKEVCDLTESLLTQTTEIESFITANSKLDDERHGEQLAGRGMTFLNQARDLCDRVELLVDDVSWSLPKYREMLYLI